MSQHQFQFLHEVRAKLNRDCTINPSVAKLHPAYQSAMQAAEQILFAEGRVVPRSMRKRWINFISDCACCTPFNWREQLETLIAETEF